MTVLPFRPRPPAPAATAAQRGRPDSDTRARTAAIPIVGRIWGEDVEMWVSQEELDRLMGRPPRG